MSEPITASDQHTGVLFIHALTPLHPGSGTALGAVDLPVQRERHTNWPLIPGSSLKGILRDAYREQIKGNYQDDAQKGDENGRPRSRRQKANEDDPTLVAVFGPGKVDESASHAGAVTFTDARILAFPVRSLCGVFAWVTCPAVLERLCRDLELAGVKPPGLPATPPGESQALTPEKSPLLASKDRLVLEEFEFQRVGDCQTLAAWLSQRAVGDRFGRQRFESHLAVLHDDDFTHFVRHATEVTARIGLDYETKTVKTGALFYQEFLPAETLFYAITIATESRWAKKPMSPGDVFATVAQSVAQAGSLQIGGDETIGKGLCAVRMVDSKEIS